MTTGRINQVTTGRRPLGPVPPRRAQGRGGSPSAPRAPVGPAARPGRDGRTSVGPAAPPAVSLCASHKPTRALRRPRGTRPPGGAWGPAGVSGRRTRRCAAGYALCRQSPSAHQISCRSPHPAGIPRVRLGGWPPHEGYRPPRPRWSAPATRGQRVADPRGARAVMERKEFGA